MTIKELQAIIKDIENSPLMTLELEMDDFKLKLSKNKFEPAPVPLQNTPVAQPKVEIPVTEVKPVHSAPKNLIKSPLVGTFYASATINGNPYVEVGQPVKKGQVVCIIEAMKIMNEITSPYDGVIKEIFVRNGEVVGYDHDLMVVSEHEK
ncbi:acetyl-CoA carboxylase biotin carboxyl carrier protein [Acholeplasma vituli]|uniref:Biotin carboxyl carrier protein of acetyl-CoA carboxylase n=1 Tax=Paracholeplasma vituli TaxID=69473 RepID=A0ABT2PUU1_9MOLU|nr:acetyl-CoA carboxylase biotin carboxyl carrier protein [Paracholeplasma vituli]MCU0104713.1 acetyl-CoA carboxylase biotin carboxyl carrier protein [Paracholeplasma vituli]